MGNDNIIKMDSKIVMNDKVIFSEMDGESIIMNIERGEFYGINAIGNRIWNLLHKSMVVSDICEQLQPDYDITPEQCAKDVLLFLNKMAEKNVVKIINNE